MVDKKIILSMIVCLLLINVVSSLEFDNVKSDITLTKGEALTIGDKEIAYNYLWETYKPIEVKNAFGLGESLFKGAITKHTISCSSNCESIMAIELKKKGQLIQEIRFKKLVGEEWIDYDFSRYNIYYSNKEETYEEDIYETQCKEIINDKNGTITLNCSDVKTGTQIKTRPVWNSYNNEEVEAGTYQIKIAGDKKDSQIIDWQIKTNGQWLEDWAVWGIATGNLISYYKLDEASGTIIDSLGTNNGTDGGATPNTFGKINTAYSFDGTNDYMNLTNGITPTQNITINVWVYRNSSSDLFILGKWLFSAPDTNGRAYALSMASNKAKFWISSDGTDPNTSSVVSTVSLGLNQWYMITGTFNGTLMSIYVNGVLNGTTAKTSGISNEVAVPTFVGVQNGGGATLYSYWNGSIDEIVIFNKSLSQSEINLLYNSGIGQSYPFSTVSLNSPANNNLSNNATQTFNCSATPTSPATLRNISLWTNATGTWQLNETDSYLLSLLRASDVGSHGKTLGHIGLIGSPTTNGQRIKIKSQDVYLVNATLHSSAGTNGTIDVFDETLTTRLATATVSGTDVVFNSSVKLLANTEYYLVVYTPSSTHVRYNSSMTTPIETTYFNWTGESSSLASGVLMDFLSITTNTINTSILSTMTNYTSTFTKTLPENSTIWNCQACDSDGDCAFSSSNYTITIDSTAPTITATLNTSVITTWGNNITLNYAISDANISSCWYNYNNTNTSLTCSGTQKNITTASGYYGITIYANDSVGYSATPVSLYFVIAPNTTLNSPANNTYSASSSQTFSCSGNNISVPASVTNVSLWTNSTGTWQLNETKTIFETEFTTGNFAGEYVTSGIGQDPTSTNEANAIDSSLSTVATFRTYCSGATCTQALHSNYTINTLNKKTVVINFYADAFGSAGSFGSYIYNFTDGSWETIDIQFNEGASDKNVSYSLDSSLINSTGQSIIKFVTFSNGAGTWSYYAYVREIMVTGSTATFTKTLPQNSTKWTCQACSSYETASTCSFATSNYTIRIDSLTPTITITGGNGTNNYSNLGSNHTINFTVTDVNLSSCWYYNGTINKSLSSCSLNHLNETIDSISDNITLYANDTLGNTASQFVNWSFKILYNNRTYNTQAIEQSQQTFVLNTSILPNYFDNAYATLIYNGTEYSSTKSTSGDNTLFTNTITVPLISSNTNMTFYWIVNSTSGDSYQTNTTNQTILNIALDDCSSYPTLIYNFTIKDEQNKSGYPLYNGTLKLDLSLSTYGTTSVFLSYNKSYNSTSQKAVCANINLSDFYRVDLIGEYTITDHVTEFYYVDNGTLSNSTIPILKSLYSLLTTDSTTFLLTFKDSATIPVADAIVHVYRYYVDEARFYEVETAKTDDNGQTHVHLVEEDVIYMFMVDKNSVWIYNSSNYNAKCISTPCEIQLFESANISPEIPTSIGNSFTISSDTSARTVTLDFALNSPEQVTFGLYKFDKGVTTLLTNETINTSVGSITLDVPSTYGNLTHFVAVFENGEHIKSEFVSFDESARETFGILGVILGSLLVLTIILMSISEGALLILFICLAVLLIWLLKLFEMNWMTMASIIIVGAVIIFKLVSRGRKQV